MMTTITVISITFGNTKVLPGGVYPEFADCD